MDRAPKILIVDDDLESRILLFEALSRKGYEVSVAENGSVALNMARRNAPDILITALRMPVMEGMELLHIFRRRFPEVSTVLMTASASIETAVKAMKCGAYDYIIKPFPAEVMEDTVERLTSSALHKQAFDVPRRRIRAEKPIIGNDKTFVMLMDRARNEASGEATVLVQGESGTGKRGLARFLHSESDRRDGPFVVLNCASLPESLLERELFGQEKGAFTGAVTTKKGKFELADRGTLLLEEIGEIPPHLQAKLFRVLQEGEVARLGSRSPIAIDVHVVATTSRSLEEAANNGTFRQDLFSLLNAIPLVLPPLRDRKGDIPLLAEHFIEKYSRVYTKTPKEMSGRASERFMQYRWPGNVREMEKLVERAVLLCNGNFLDVGDFWIDEEASSEIQSKPFMDILSTGGLPGGSGPLHPQQEPERQMILKAFHQADNNRIRAAKLIRASVRTLRNKLQKFRTEGVAD